MNIYKPYTYHLYHIPTNHHYYGVRYANSKRDSANPNDLWVTYFSSSKKVKDLIEKYGKDSFKVKVRRVFNNADAARAWEHKVLRRLKVHTKPQWLNVSYYKCPNNYGAKRSDQYRDYIRNRMIGTKLHLGHSHSEETKTKISLARKGRYQMTKEHREKLNAALCKRIKVILPNGSIVIADNLSQFCRDNRLDQSHASKVLRGLIRHHKGYRFNYLND